MNTQFTPPDMMSQLAAALPGLPQMAPALTPQQTAIVDMVKARAIEWKGQGIPQATVDAQLAPYLVQNAGISPADASAIIASVYAPVLTAPNPYQQAPAVVATGTPTAATINPNPPASLPVVAAQAPAQADDTDSDEDNAASKAAGAVKVPASFTAYAGTPLRSIKLKDIGVLHAQLVASVGQNAALQAAYKSRSTYDGSGKREALKLDCAALISVWNDAAHIMAGGVQTQSVLVTQQAAHPAQPISVTSRASTSPVYVVLESVHVCIVAPGAAIPDGARVVVV
jgi:hypothetical protein